MRYVLEGLVQRDPQTGCGSTRSSSTRRPVRISGPTVSRKDVADLFKLQDQVVARLANALGYELVKGGIGSGRTLEKPSILVDLLTCAAGPR